MTKIEEAIVRIDKNLGLLTKDVLAKPSKEWTETKIDTTVNDKIEQAKLECALAQKTTKKKFPLKDIIYTASILGAGIAGYLQ